MGLTIIFIKLGVSLFFFLPHVVVSSWKIPVLFDSSNVNHRNINYHPEQPARIDTCLRKLKGQPGIQLIDISPESSNIQADDIVSRQPFSDKELQYARTMLLKAHSPDFVANFETKCRESRQRRVEQGRDPLGFVGNIDEDTFITTETFDICLRAAAAWIRSIDAAMHTSNVSRAAMALTRPPGHHATYDTANGFCLVNFAAVAAIHAMESNPNLRISVFDWDVHYGQGVANILQKYDRARYVSIHQSPAFPYLGGKYGISGDHQNILTIPIVADTTWSSGYKEKFERDVLSFIKSDNWQPDIVLICAGYDALDSDELASVGLVADDYGEMVQKLKHNLASDGNVSIPIVLGLEGGYQLSEMAAGGNLGDAVVATIRALMQTQ